MDVDGDRPRGEWSILATVDDGRSLLAVSGELDALTAEDLHRRIAEIHDGDVELDLSGVTFIDSSGLAAVIEEHLRLQHVHRHLSVTGRSSVVQRVLDLSGVSSQLDLDARGGGP
jgi:anti-anti-sigma factor